jgi:hypothetical protein
LFPIGSHVRNVENRPAFQGGQRDAGRFGSKIRGQPDQARPNTCDICRLGLATTCSNGPSEFCLLKAIRAGLGRPPWVAVPSVRAGGRDCAVRHWAAPLSSARLHGWREEADTPGIIARTVPACSPCAEHARARRRRGGRYRVAVALRARSE